jgi:hypothetical protein
VIVQNLLLRYHPDERIMGFISWLFSLFGPSEESPPVSEKERKRREDEEQREIEELVALEII